MNTVCLHIGTHKTGTKTIQSFLGANRALLRQAGVYVPLAGRQEVSEDAYTPGHHALAWDSKEGADNPHLRALLDEIRASEAPLVVCSSEELHPLYLYPERIRAIVDAFASIGYQTDILIYLRDRARYAESLFAEINKTYFVGSYDSFVNDAIANGSCPSRDGQLCFEYALILRAFASVVGPSHVIARPYRTDLGPDFLLRDFLTVLARLRGGLDLKGLANPLPTANPSQSLGTLLNRIHTVAVSGDPASEVPYAPLVTDATRALFDHRFLLTTREQVLRFVERFSEDTQCVRDEFGCTLAVFAESNVPPANSPLWDETSAQRTIFAHALALWGLR